MSDTFDHVADGVNTGGGGSFTCEFRYCFSPAFPHEILGKQKETR